jgi:hypothetical protein
MPDTDRPVATDRDQARHRYTLSLHHVQIEFDRAQLPRTMRTLQRYCESGRLNCLKTETPTGDAYVVDPLSVERAIGELKLIHGDRQDATSRDVSPPVAPVIEPKEETDMSRPTATGRDIIEEKTPVVDVQPTPTGPDVARHAATDLDIYEHPYVKRLETQLEKLETKYEAQVRRTEEVQLRAHDKLVELQRMTTIGQSKTLADFMLQAKNWIVGGASDDAVAAPTGVGDGKTG